MTTKSEISRNSYRETTITLTTVRGKCPEVEKLLCTLPGTPQRPLGLFAMKNTINKNFPTAQNFVFRKFLFFDDFRNDFRFTLCQKPIPDLVWDSKSSGGRTKIAPKIVEK